MQDFDHRKVWVKPSGLTAAFSKPKRTSVEMVLTESKVETMGPKYRPLTLGSLYAYYVPNMYL